MALTSGTTAKPSDATSVDAPNLQWFVFALFFIFGGITSLNDVIIPKLQDLFGLSFAAANLVNTFFFVSYLIFSLPAAAIVRRIGYMRTATVGLLTMTAGCLLFVPASASSVFVVFLIALFVLGAGITTVQVVANPLISVLGPARTASSRLTFAQFFNSVGTTVFPFVGSVVILGGLGKIDPTASATALAAYRSAETQTVVFTYLALAAALLVVAVVVWMQRDKLKDEQDQTGSILHAFGLLKRPRFALGALCIFLYVGAEVAIGSNLVKYLQLPTTFGLDRQTAGKYVLYYWGGAMIGRLVGSGVLRVVAPGKVLAANATGAILLILVSANSMGVVSGWSLLAIGLLNSIMFPTIFTLASEGLGKRAAEGSGIIASAIVGGAIIPPLTGLMVDRTGLQFALLIPALCYGVIASYGWFARKSVTG